jgi:hypothetical protein
VTRAHRGSCRTMIARRVHLMMVGASRAHWERARRILAKIVRHQAGKTAHHHSSPHRIAREAAEIGTSARTAQAQSVGKSHRDAQTRSAERSCQWRRRQAGRACWPRSRSRHGVVRVRWQRVGEPEQVKRKCVWLMRTKGEIALVNCDDGTCSTTRLSSMTLRLTAGSRTRRRRRRRRSWFRLSFGLVLTVRIYVPVEFPVVVIPAVVSSAVEIVRSFDFAFAVELARAEHPKKINER